MLNNFFVDFVIYHNILTVRTKAYLCEGYYRHVNKVEDIRLCSFVQNFILLQKSNI